MLQVRSHCIRRFYAVDLPVPVFGLDIIGKGLGFLWNGVAVTMTVVIYHSEKKDVSIYEWSMSASNDAKRNIRAWGSSSGPM